MPIMRRLADYMRMKIEQGALNDDLQKLTRDLTKEVAERRQIATELEESSQRFRAIGDHALDAIIIADDKGEAVYWNAAAERTFGYSADEITGRNFHKMLAPERYREKAIEALRAFCQYRRRRRSRQDRAARRPSQGRNRVSDGVALSAMKPGRRSARARHCPRRQ